MRPKKTEIHTPNLHAMQQHPHKEDEGQARAKLEAKQLEASVGATVRAEDEVNRDDQHAGARVLHYREMYETMPKTATTATADQDINKTKEEEVPVNAAALQLIVGEGHPSMVGALCTRIVRCYVDQNDVVSDF
jgi:hypothetical protein